MLHMAGVLDQLKGKKIEIKGRELSTMTGVLVDYDNVYVVVKVGNETYYIPHYNVIYITPA